MLVIVMVIITVIGSSEIITPSCDVVVVVAVVEAIHKFVKVSGKQKYYYEHVERKKEKKNTLVSLKNLRYLLDRKVENLRGKRNFRMCSNYYFS